MRRIKKIAIVFFALLVILGSVVTITEREEAGTVVMYSVLAITSMLCIVGLTVTPFPRTFVISNTKAGVATIGSGSVKRLITRTVDKKSVKVAECEIKKTSPTSMDIRVIAGISTATSAIEFSDEVKNEVKRVVETETGLDVTGVDVHVWYYNKRKKL